eukprot:Unigene2_Nuclearia_a/m.8 Unigene2_Nuclearia_a/g.8  ORF Unigene2_Nuclearia_a/g.8 Unigene2_Nuclearia_a/m.8 type:complete len:526 (+) Unigene2_Nuclearia_a:1754-3331(+)
MSTGSGYGTPGVLRNMSTHSCSLPCSRSGWAGSNSGRVSTRPAPCSATSAAFSFMTSSYSSSLIASSLVCGSGSTATNGTLLDRHRGVVVAHGVRRRRKAVLAAPIGQDLARLERVAPAVDAARHIAAREARVAALAAEPARLEVDLGRADEVVGADHVVVEHLDRQLLVARQHTAKDRVDVARSAVFLVVDRLVLAKLHNHERVRQAVVVARRQVHRPHDVQPDERLDGALVGQTRPDLVDNVLVAVHARRRALLLAARPAAAQPQALERAARAALLLGRRGGDGDGLAARVVLGRVAPIRVEHKHGKVALEHARARAACLRRALEQLNGGDLVRQLVHALERLVDHVDEVALVLGPRLVVADRGVKLGPPVDHDLLFQLRVRVVSRQLLEHLDGARAEALERLADAAHVDDHVVAQLLGGVHRRVALDNGARRRLSRAQVASRTRQVGVCTRRRAYRPHLDVTLRLRLGRRVGRRRARDERLRGLCLRLLSVGLGKRELTRALLCRLVRQVLVVLVLESGRAC